ncbi:MAG: hypothetical protein JO040_05980 [Gemmatimonadetes bacterium]|nr:hypothetical protein [Gemmatimonadota bacterium]
MGSFWKSGLVLVLSACAGRAGPGDHPSSTAEIPVLVVNGSADMVRVQAPGSATLRLAPSQQGCLHLRTTATSVVLEAVPVGGVPEGSGVGQGRTATSTQRSRSFNPMDARAWEWRLDINPTTANTSLRPADEPCR